jgi:hypothetical protein
MMMLANPVGNRVASIPGKAANVALISLRLIAQPG